MLDTAVGEVYGYWTVTGNSFLNPDRRKNGRFVPVRCQCGAEKEVQRYHLMNGLTKMCRACKGREHSRLLSIPDSGWNTFYYRYQENAGRGGKVVLLSKEEFRALCEKDCDYCGEPPSQKTLSNSQSIIANGIDRVDSGKDYTLENSVPCCRDCNWMKNNMDKDKFLNQVEKIYKHELKRPR